MRGLDLGELLSDSGELCRQHSEDVPNLPRQLVCTLLLGALQKWFDTTNILTDDEVELSEEGVNGAGSVVVNKRQTGTLPESSCNALIWR